MTEQEFKTVFDEACAAADKAANDVYEAHGEPFYCGFAWVQMAGNTAFARQAKRAGVARTGYPKGVCISTNKMQSSLVSRTQSMWLKEVAATAFAKVLNDAGVNCYAASRAD